MEIKKWYCLSELLKDWNTPKYKFFIGSRGLSREQYIKWLLEAEKKEENKNDN